MKRGAGGEGAGAALSGVVFNALKVEGKRRGNPGGGTEISDAACDRCAA